MADQADHAVPLCVDLDGTLVRTDLLHEALLIVAKRSPLALGRVAMSLRGGKAAFKDAVARLAAIDPAALPYRQEVLDLIREARAEGRPVILCTASPAPFAQAVADHLGLFDAVMTSSASTNLSRDQKAAALAERYGERGFDYVGNCDHDLPVFARARRGYLVSSSGRLHGRSARLCGDMHSIEDGRGGWRAWRKAIRVHQWVKNLLIFVPVVAGHAAGDPARLANALLAFIAFSLCASAIYIANDLLDLAADRAHRNKCRRPFASGALPVSAGVVASPLLLLAAFALALALPWRFAVVLLVYLAATTAYSFLLKRQVVVDVMLLAGLYTLRIIAGAAATAVTPSFWLLGFSMFIFLCLAMVKRFSELRQVAGDAQVVGRGYTPADMSVLQSLGASSGMIAVLILALYTQSEMVVRMYAAPEWLWLVPPVTLYWVTRLWLKANRGEVDDDPVVFAIRDWQSLVVLALLGALFVLAMSGLRAL